MRSKIVKLVRLTPSDWWGFSIAFLYLLWAGWRLFVRKEKLDQWVINHPTSSFSKGGLEGVSLSQVETVVESKPKKPLTEEERHTLGRRARSVNSAARYPWPWARCLQRSLALCLWLKHQGLQPVLTIGVRKDDNSLSAHAWVEFCGEIINDSPGVSRMFVPMTGPSPGLARARHWVKGNQA